MSGGGLPSKAAFLERNVIPANDNDVFNDNTCVLCWDSYNDEHPAVRVLPCNHVFGRDCLPQLLNAPNGDFCAICSTQLFQPSRLISFKRIFTPHIERLGFRLVAIMNRLEIAPRKLGEAADAMPQPLQPWIGCARHIIFLWLNVDNVYFYADGLIDRTSLRLRNPNLDINLAKQKYRSALTIFACLRVSLSIPNTSIVRMCGSVVLLLYLSFSGAPGRLSNSRDRFIFTAIMIMALFIHFFTLAIMLPPKIGPLETVPNELKYLERMEIERRNKEKLGNMGLGEGIKMLYFLIYHR